MVGCVEPGPSVCVEHPTTPAARVAQFRLESPTVCPQVDQLGWVVLTGGRDHPETDAENRLLPPFGVILPVHGRTAQEVHREAERCAKQAGTMYVRLSGLYSSTEVANAVRQGRGYVGGAAKEVEGVKKGEHRSIDLSP